MTILFLDEFSKKNVQEVINFLEDGNVIITRSIDPEAVISAMESLLSIHEGESSGFEVERILKNDLFLIHDGRIRLRKHGNGVLLSGGEIC